MAASNSCCVGNWARTSAQTTSQAASEPSVSAWRKASCDVSRNRWDFEKTSSSTLESTALRTRCVVLRIPGRASHQGNLLINIHGWKNPRHSVDRICRRGCLSSQKNAVVRLELQHLPRFEAKLLPQRLRDGHLPLLRDSALHTNIVGIHTFKVNPRGAAALPRTHRCRDAPAHGEKLILSFPRWMT